MTSKLSHTEAINRLQELRQTGERQPDFVVTIGKDLLHSGGANKMGDEVWNFYEQLCIAALDVGDMALADNCLSRLKKRFPRSARVKRLEGMTLEAEGKLEEAQQIYTKILEEDETDSAVLKRGIAIRIAKGEMAEAIAALNSYLEFYYNDPEAWGELCSLYMREHMYQQASHCAEELILLQPHNHLHHLRHAEIQRTLGNLDVALKAFCRVVEMCTDHVRALYGMQACSAQLLRESGGKGEYLAELNELATERLLDVYSRGNAPDHVKQVVRKWVEETCN
ncbi:uncharacterized protein VTP21DRAFT_5298 [Calcarisporiella thermophila]|uniref:uncharacterized protein n=1 Tax=Calcarisporiella thermophila TaxID=911321 RepID=UPI0037427D08